MSVYLAGHISYLQVHVKRQLVKKSIVQKMEILFPTLLTIVLGGLLMTSVRATDDDVIYGYENPESNLIQNGGFEEEIEDSNVWEVSNGEIQYMSDAHTGSRSVKIKNRSARFGGIKQKVYNVSGNTMYYASSFIKTLTASQDDMYYKIRMWIGYQDKEEVYTKKQIGRLENQRRSLRWKQLGGDFITPDIDLEYLEVFFECVDQSMIYLVDSVSLIVIPRDPEWSQKADEAILEHRTNTVTIKGVIPRTIPYCLCELKVNQTRSDFGFGSAVQADRFNEETEFGDTYRKFHYDHFNWAVLINSMKWKPMEPVQGHPNLERVDRALDNLLAHNITVRGHSILWGTQKNNPQFVSPLNGESLREEILRRVDYLVNHFKGRIHEWDVINEWLHGTFYDLATGTNLIQKQVFTRSHARDPETKLMANDFQALRTGDFTSALVDQVQELADKDVPVHGIGIQSHLTVPVPVEILRKRLQIATASGFPVTITELNVFATNVNERAAKLDEALKVYFSDPGVRAIVFWCVSDQQRVSHEPEQTALFVGPDFTPNAAGQVYEELRRDWSTNAHLRPRERNFSADVRAFHGAYNVEMLYRGQSVKNQTFYLNPGSDLTFTMQLSEDDFLAADDQCQ